MRSWRTFALPCYYESKRNQRLLIPILEPLLLGSYLTLIKKKKKLDISEDFMEYEI